MYSKLYEWLDRFLEKIKDHQNLHQTFRNCFLSTLETTTELIDNDQTFVITGDIPAMWLRDSSVQVSHYLKLVDQDSDTDRVIKGLIRKQLELIIVDPYANAFKKNGLTKGNHDDDLTDLKPEIWERKYEIDSLCYPLWLTHKYYQKTHDKTLFDDTFHQAVRKILDVFKTEQYHEEKSTYRFQRLNCYMPTDTLVNEGKGSKVGYTGMTWSGFRPSDDACTYHYLVPSNMFAVRVLDTTMTIYKDLNGFDQLILEMKTLRDQIQKGIETYGIYHHETYGDIYAYEVDGLGNHLLMDDANVPSLLSLPYLEYLNQDDEIYQNTRAFILSHSNPFYYSGKKAKGVGSPHTPKDHVWPISLCIEALTTKDLSHQFNIVKTLLSTHANTFFMHESLHVDDPSVYTREWFAWANTLFSVLIMSLEDHLDALVTYLHESEVSI